MTAQYLMDICAELQNNAEFIKDEELHNAAAVIKEAKRIFVAGAGRSGFAARAFSNRLMHLGLTVYFVGDCTTPSIQAGDLLVIGSGSGETGSLVTMAKKATAQGAKIMTVTIRPEASIGSMASAIVTLPGATKSGEGSTCKTIQPMASAFEQMSWLVYDVIIHYLMEDLGKSEADMFALHANLE